MDSQTSQATQSKTRQGGRKTSGAGMPTSLLVGRERADTGSFLKNWPKNGTVRKQAEMIGNFIREYVRGNERLCNCKVLVMKGFEMYSDYFVVEVRDNYTDKYPLVSISITKNDVSHSLSYKLLHHMAPGTMTFDKFSLEYRLETNLAGFVGGTLIPYLDECPARRHETDPAAEQREQLIYELSKDFYNAKSNGGMRKAARRLYGMIAAENKSEEVMKGLKFSKNEIFPERQDATITLMKDETVLTVKIEGKDYSGNEKGTRTIEHTYERPGLQIGPGSRHFIAETQTRDYLRDLLADAAEFPSHV